MDRQAPTPGLQDVTACESRICYIDGEAGKLYYRGYDIKDVARSLSFEDTAHLLWHGRPPTSDESSTLAAELRGLRPVPNEIMATFRKIASGSDPVSVLRVGMAMLASMEEASNPQAFTSPIATAKGLASKMATMLAAIHRMRLGHDPIQPSGQLGHADNLLYMLHGREPTITESKALETILVLYAEHELNASTFAARVTVGTQADAHSAVLAAVCALKGPLHGGAINDVNEMLTDVGTPEKAQEWVSAAFNNRRKIPGFGHRVYRVEDPRATYLRDMALQLADQAHERQSIDVAMSIQAAVQDTKPLNVNVDYFAAPVLSSLGIPPELFTAVVASTRVTGWTAHAIEQYSDNRLIRPRAVYRGETGLSLATHNN